MARRRAGCRVLRDGPPRLAVIEVTDDGPGIPPDQLEQVFERFPKGADSNGSGLGLTISRDLVVAHGGTISVTSDVGSGATFTVTVPLTAEA